MVKFTFVDNGSCGDPLGEGEDPGLGLGHHATQARMLPGAGAPVSVSNSLLDGADAGQWVERTARLTAFTSEANGRCQGTLWASLSGSTTLDRAELVIVDHPAEASAFATPQGLMVGMRRPVASLTDAEGRDLSAALTAGNSEPAFVSGGSPLTVEADTSASALVLECARLGEPGTSDSSGIVVEGFDGVSWQELGRVHARRSRDTLAVATGGAAQLRLTPLSEMQLWAVDALQGSDSLAALTSTVTVPISSTSRPGAAHALAFADSAGVTLGSSQSLMLTFDGPPLPETGVRSLFLKLRALYEKTGTGLVHNQQAGDGAILPFALHPNQPNPFAHGTTIRFDTPMSAFVRIEAFDAGGRRVRTLVDGQFAAGAHALAWNGADDAGRPLRPGVYLVRMAAGPFTAKRRMVLLGN